MNASAQENGPVRYARAVTLMEAELGDELVALDAKGGNCFGFSNVATFVWRLLETPKTTAEISAALLEQYEVDQQTCSTELRDLLDQLQSLGLIAPVPA